MTTTREEDLVYVRRELDAISFARFTGAMAPGDDVRYSELCDEELALLTPMHLSCSAIRISGVSISGSALSRQWDLVDH